ncbi:DUF2264 domain-containing protein [Hydrocarboniclastica marina]|uniref:DUF2264 domain-containing protein n=1 Tax=Hydrocarboniclastica marina TaxID=2259620 RepID=A0A4P7XID2_9ALTE|nr:DUF2264 domain-containing protein [Hydrocarboniclastica marina]
MPLKTTREYVQEGQELTRLAVGLGRKLPGLLRRYRFPRAAEKLLDGFLSDQPENDAYHELVRYFATSWVTYRNQTGCGAVFPGLPSWSGTECDALEGFSRMMPLFAAWCASGRDPSIALPGNRQLLLSEEFKRGLIAGTDPSAPTYWGDMPGKSNQRIVEAADIALSLWLLRDRVWCQLNKDQQKAVVNWLSLVNGRPGLDNNWHLFFVLIDRVLASLGHAGRIEGVRERFDRIKSFHLGDGWFKDGPEGRVDFYSAWGFHYALTWINRIDPEWDPAFIDAAQARFLKTYRYLIGPQGLPIMGRSVQYRIAVAAPLVAGAESHPAIVAAGEARRALDVTWQYFIQHGALRHGIISQGYHGSNARILDPYAGPASSLWSLRSLVMAFYYPPDHEFWNSEPLPLPVEQGDYDVPIAGPGWKVTGARATDTITIEVMHNPEDACPRLEHFWRKHALQNLAFGSPPRPKSLEAKYGRRFYSSARPFFME